MSYPSTYSAFRRSGLKGSKEHRLSIVRTDNETLPKELGPHDVVIKMHAVSLNYREIAMLIGTYPMALEDKGIPCSDAAAEVIATGSAVSHFAAGDRVCPITIIQEREDGPTESIGATTAGVLREYAVFKDADLVPIPAHLSWEEASTLPCAGLTAWNALEGFYKVPKGSFALLQGTGGVSMFSLVLCLAAGVRPIITSSSDEKLAAIKKLSPEILGLNYKTVTDQAAEIQRLTGGVGVRFVVNNTGPKSLMDDISFLTKRNGTVSMVGFLDGFDADWSAKDIMVLMHKAAKLRGIGIGDKEDFEDMNRYIEEKKVSFSPLLTERPFKFADAQAAYDLLESGKFTGKVIITFDE